MYGNWGTVQSCWSLQFIRWEYHNHEPLERNWRRRPKGENDIALVARLSLYSGNKRASGTILASFILFTWKRAIIVFCDAIWMTNVRAKRYFWHYWTEPTIDLTKVVRCNALRGCASFECLFVIWSAVLIAIEPYFLLLDLIVSHSLRLLHAISRDQHNPPSK